VLSDVLLIPFLPRSVDVWALADIAVLVDEARTMRDGLTAYAVLSAATNPGTSSDNTEAAEALAEFPQLSLGTAYLIEGQFTEARDTLIACTEVIRKLRTMYGYLPWVLALLAEAHLARGEFNKALAAAREGIEHSRSGGCIYYEASAQIALARILLATGGAAAHVKIAAALNRAEELVAMVDGRALSPRIIELRGRLAAALGDRPASEQAPRAALDLYREIGAIGHAERLVLDIHPSSKPR
jgi:tetratricopeptide (TPR) repeat protein